MSDRPHRLPGFSYVGCHRYSLTFCVRSRNYVFTIATIVADALEQISLAALARGFAICAYCFMPDHLHLLVEGQADNSDLVKFVNLQTANVLCLSPPPSGSALAEGLFWARCQRRWSYTDRGEVCPRKSSTCWFGEGATRLSVFRLSGLQPEAIVGLLARRDTL